MLRCDKCNRDFTNSSAIKRHKCIEAIETMPETKETVLDSLEAQIEALLERRRNTYDAETRYSIDLKIKELRNV